MSDNDRHLKFKLIRNYLLALHDADTPRISKKYWRSLEELTDSPVFREFVAREFPQQADADLNLNARWINTLALALRIRTPVGPFGVDFGYLLDPPEFLIPQASGRPAIFRPKPFRIHIRFGQAF